MINKINYFDHKLISREMGLEFSFTLSWFVFPPQQPFPVFPDLKNCLAYLLKNENLK